MPPEDARQQLAHAAEHFGIELSASQVDALMAHVTLLDRWSKTYNLTAVRDPAQMLRQHLVDSLALVAPLKRHLRDSGSPTVQMLDVGSGAGFPGLTVSIAMPQVQMICIDSVGKKAGFMRQVIAEVGLTNARAIHGRVEELEALQCDLIASRAFASLSDFAALTRRHLNEHGCWVAMKGQHPSKEIEELPSAVQVFHVEQLEVPYLEAERCLVWMRPSCG